MLNHVGGDVSGLSVAKSVGFIPIGGVLPCVDDVGEAEGLACTQCKGDFTMSS